MMIMWRIWHNHNEMTHDKPCPSIEGSHRFLVIYLSSVRQIKQYPDTDLEKVKIVIEHAEDFKNKYKNDVGRRKI
jgi:hypothetical protein